ncbi:hypothetical protein [Streptomyces sp.]|uniref:hypothetical protein n=1 Tax=Streptomyces sp. TaxID=1931 RepID=UPI002F40794C
MTTDDTDPLLRQLLRIPEAEEFLAWPGDFEPSRSGHGEEIHLPSGVPLKAVAGDGAGGTYYQVGAVGEANRPVLYVSAEGEAGLIADSLAEALELLIGLPYWQDCLPGRGFLPDGLEAQYRTTFPDLDERRDRVAALLGLGRPPAAELMTRLHACVARSVPEYLPVNAKEETYEPLR